MKYIKPILIIVITASVAGFVIWHLMWMTEIEKKLRTEQSSGPSRKIEEKAEKNTNHRGKTEKSKPVTHEGGVSLPESRTQINQAEKTLQERETRGDSNADVAPGLPRGDTTSKSEKGTVKWFEKDIGLGKKAQQEQPEPGETTTEILRDKTMSVTIKNKANPVMQKNIPQPQPMIKYDVQGTGSVTSYPTSTAP
ncbi:MAG TPA: hypothetical protein DDX85_00785 [Nitrospiraceae bacterium]|nr:hypothetical protein [Nitrospiraceae bacterium]